MSNKIAFIFTGQGEQINLNSPQVVTFWIQISLAKIMMSNGIMPNAVAGLSLGELTAISISGAIATDEMEKLLEARSKLMDEELSQTKTGMVACINYNLTALSSIVKEYGLEITNYNSPRQVVVGGLVDVLENFCQNLPGDGTGMTVKLDTPGAFHSSFLKNASRKFGDILEGYGFKKPKISFYANLTGGKEDSIGPDLIAGQMCSPVQFQKIIENMVADGIDTFYSIGVGSTPVNLIRDICRDKKIRAKVCKIENIEDVRRMVK